jgi:D-cysteine desulfhydrase
MNEMEREEREAAIGRLESIERLELGYYPTPVEELARLRAALGRAPRILIKHDDYTGIGFGGNKVRKLEYVLARARAKGTEVVITLGGEKSNHARMTAALCARLGLRCLLVLNRAAKGTVPDGLKPAAIFIDEAFGAEVHLVESREERTRAAESLAARERGAGRKTMVIPLGASVPLGALGFVRAIKESAQQFESLGVRPDYIFHASSSGGTQAGILAGCRLFGLDRVKVVGVSPDDPAASIAEEVARITAGIGELLDFPMPVASDQIAILDQYIGPGYGIETPESSAALRLLAKTEGVMLDPVYTAKAMAALIDQTAKGNLKEDQTVLFWHTGGQIALFFTPASSS